MYSISIVGGNDSALRKRVMCDATLRVQEEYLNADEIEVVRRQGTLNTIISTVLNRPTQLCTVLSAFCFLIYSFSHPSHPFSLSLLYLPDDRHTVADLQ